MSHSQSNQRQPASNNNQSIRSSRSVFRNKLKLMTFIISRPTCSARVRPNVYQQELPEFRKKSNSVLKGPEESLSKSKWIAKHFFFYGSRNIANNRPIISPDVEPYSDHLRGHLFQVIKQKVVKLLTNTTHEETQVR